MESLYDILNIKKIDIEKMIREVIIKTKKELVNLDKERTCLIYTSYLYQNLQDENILSYIVDTMEDLGKDFQHRFIVIPKDEDSNYVLDLTVSQFGENLVFKNMESFGYQLLNKDEYDLYIEYVSGNKGRYK